MKRTQLLGLLFLLIITSSSNCKKTLFGENLPAATQEGKNTCGFLVNGKVWVASKNGFDELSSYYDPTFNGGTFHISAKKYNGGSSSDFTSFAVASYNISGTGYYKLNINPDAVGIFSNSINYCFLNWDDTIPNHNAFLNISKFDLQNGIISGTFEFALTKTGCETVRITQGRFDMKY
ncbi:MAG: hypothetical protein ABL872_01050 [Lacibacter sp.]